MADNGASSTGGITAKQLVGHIPELDGQDVERLASMRRHPGWEVFTKKLLPRLKKEMLLTMIRESDHKATRAKGAVAILAQFENRVQQQINLAKRRREEKQKEQKSL